MRFSVIYAVLSAVIFPFVPSVSADSYQHEIGVSYLEPDYQGDIDAYMLHVNGTRYFAPVDTGNLPFAEAAFLRKASSLSLHYINADTEGGLIDAENNQRSVEINLYLPDSIFFIGAAVEQSKSRYRDYYSGEDGGYPVDVELDWESTWVGRLGVTPLDGLLVWSEFYEDVDVSDYWNLKAKYVQPLANNRAIGIESSFSRFDVSDGETLDVLVDYYFTQALSLGAGVFLYNYDDSSNEEEFMVRTRYFFTENISLDFTYRDSDFSDTWKLGGSIRF